MRPPLIRPGAGQADVDRIYDLQDQQRAELLRMIDTANSTEDQQDLRRRGIIGARSPAGDEHRLRGIPAIARGVAGAIPGTSPHNQRNVTSDAPAYDQPRTVGGREYAWSPPAPYVRTVTSHSHPRVASCIGGSHVTEKTETVETTETTTETTERPLTNISITAPTTTETTTTETTVETEDDGA